MRGCGGIIILKKFGGKNDGKACDLMEFKG